MLARRAGGWGASASRRGVGDRPGHLRLRRSEAPGRRSEVAGPPGRTGRPIRTAVPQRHAFSSAPPTAHPHWRATAMTEILDIVCKGRIVIIGGARW